MQNDNEKLAAIRRKTRQRYLFTLVTMGLYFSFTLNYTETGGEVIDLLAIGMVPGPVVMFMFLVITFIALELVFLYQAAREEKR